MAMSDMQFECDECREHEAPLNLFIIDDHRLLCRECVKAHTPYPFCHRPERCLISGRCEADPNCCE